MTNADKMFKELGWEKKEFDISIEYTKLNIGCYEEMIICFDKRYKAITIDTLLEIPELKAINEKCKELGWLDD